MYKQVITFGVSKRVRPFLVYTKAMKILLASNTLLLPFVAIKNAGIHELFPKYFQVTLYVNH